MNNEIEKFVEEFIEEMGLVTEADGLPRISGKILATMIIHDGPFSFSDLATQLKVSRGSISTNTRLLESLRIIERTSQSGERQDYFRLRENPYIELMRGVRNRIEKANSVVTKVNQQIPDDWQGAKQRLKELNDFYAEFHQATLKLTNSTN